MHNWLFWNIYRKSNFIQSKGSNYKKHNTVKFLIGITLTGIICLLSLCWGGRVSDQELTRCSRFLKLIEPGVVILADKGFHIVTIRGAKLVIPAFAKSKQQLSKRKVELSRQMACVRIHVEWVIGLLKNRYTILQSRLPISLIKRKRDEDAATVDKLLTVCAAMTNVGEPLYNSKHLHIYSGKFGCFACLHKQWTSVYQRVGRLSM